MCVCVCVCVENGLMPARNWLVIENFADN